METIGPASMMRNVLMNFQIEDIFPRHLSATSHSPPTANVHLSSISQSPSTQAIIRQLSNHTSSSSTDYPRCPSTIVQHRPTPTTRHTSKNHTAMKTKAAVPNRTKQPQASNMNVSPCASISLSGRCSLRSMSLLLSEPLADKKEALKSFV